MLLTQARSVHADQFEVEILVVDNDPAGSALPVVEAIRSEHPDEIPLRYEQESTPGISAARNRALAASIGFDLLVFIDDDERPTDRWLQLLVACRQEYGSDVVQGPVVSEFETDPDEWITAGGFFRRRRMPTGTALDVAVTNNLLLDLRVVRSLGLEFDPDLGTTGGEDTLFTRTLHRAGVPMVWCDEAIVLDVVPTSRSTRRWVRQRAISTGNSAALVTLKLAAGAPDRVVARATLAGRGLSRLAAGGARAVAGKIVRSVEHEARGTRTLLRGFGMSLGACGFAYHEYGRSGAGRIDRIPRRS
ncbi:glycosyltransferase [Microlunatus soli]